MPARTRSAIAGGREVAAEEVLRNPAGVARKHVRAWADATVTKDIEQWAVVELIICRPRSLSGRKHVRSLRGRSADEDQSGHRQTKAAGSLAVLFTELDAPDARRAPDTDSRTAMRLRVPQRVGWKQARVEVQFACERVGHVQRRNHPAGSNSVTVLVQQHRL